MRRRRCGRRWWLALAGFALAGNVAILAAHLVLGRTAPPLLHLAGVARARRVDDHLLRGDAPTPQGYASLAALGVTTVVDLRAERPALDGGSVPGRSPLRDVPGTNLHAVPEMERIHLPIRDGHAPPAGLVERFDRVVADARGQVYVHCGAGVGRTGCVVAGWQVRHGASAWSATRQALSVGPPSLEQVAWMLGLGVDVPPPVRVTVTIVSRIWDGPRRLFNRYVRRRGADGSGR